MKHDGYLLMKMLYYKLWTSNVSLWSVVREAGSRVDIQRVGVGIRNWGRHELLHGYYHVFQNWCGVSSVSGLLDDSMETGVFVSSVTHSANGAIRFYQLVVTFDFIAVTFLSLFFDIVSVWILHSVLEFVFGMSLYREHSKWTFMSQRPRGRLLGLWDRIPPVAWTFVSCECYMFWGRDLCVVLITRSEESYRLWCVWVWSGTWRMRRPRPTGAVKAWDKRDWHL